MANKEGDGTRVSASIAAILNRTADGQISRDQLDELVEKMSQRVDEVKGYVYETVQKNLNEHIKSLNDTGDLNAQLETMTRQLQEVTHNIKSGNLTQLITAPSEQRTLGRQFNIIKLTIATLQRLCKIDGHLVAFEHFIDSGDILGASTSICDVEHIIADMQRENGDGDSAGCEIAIFKVIQRDAIAKRSQLQEKLANIWRKALEFTSVDGSSIHNALKVCTVVEDIPLALLIRSMGVLKMVDEKIPGFADNVLTFLLDPFMHDSCLQPVEKSTPASKTFTLYLAAQKTETVSSSSTSGASGGSKTPQRPTAASKVKRKGSKGSGSNPGEIFEKVLSVVKSIGGHISGTPESDRVWALFGRCLWPGLSKKLMEKLVPGRDVTSEQYESIKATVQSFEKSIQEVLFLDLDSHPLLDYASQFSISDANRTREELLSSTRDLLCSENYNVVEVRHETERYSGFLTEGQPNKEPLAEPIFRLPTCQVSDVVHSLIITAYQTLSDMDATNPEKSVNLFYGVRDTFDLFRAVVPVRHEEKLSTRPQFCAVFYNDCMYIIHHLLSLGHQFRGSLPEELRTVATFVDMIPAFKKLGEGHFIRQLALQRQKLTELLSTIKGFGGCNEYAQAAAIDEVLVRTMALLLTLSKDWKVILPEEVYVRSMATLLESVVVPILHSVLTMVDINEMEAQEIIKFVGFVQAKALALFTGSDAEVKDLLAQHISDWKKFFQLPVLLDKAMRLTDFVLMSKAGTIVFSTDEVRWLIKAMFENNTLRKQALDAIK